MDLVRHVIVFDAADLAAESHLVLHVDDPRTRTARRSRWGQPSRETLAEFVAERSDR